MSNPFTFKPGVCYKLQGAVYEVCDILSDGFIVVKNLVTHQVLSQHTQDLWRHWKEGDLRFALQGNVVQEGTVQTAPIHQAAEQAIQLTCPNQRVELDQVILDLQVVDDADGLPLGCPILSGIRDQYSGYPSGITIGFGPPSSRSVLECMAYAFLEKGHVKQVIQTSNDYLACGIPDVLVVDTAMEVDRDLACACLQFGIELQQEPIAKPWLKEAIESWKATCTSDLTPVTLGTLFSNFLERGGYNPVNHACITLHALWESLHRWIVDRYTQQVQTGIGGDCDGNGIPSKLWQHALEHGFAPHLSPSCDDLFALLLHDEKRTLQHGGIIFEAISYRSRELALLQQSLAYSNAGTSVQIFYHPGDLSRVWVRDPRSFRLCEALAVHQDYTHGLSLWKHRMIKRYVREELHRDIDEESLILAKMHIQVNVQREFRLCQDSWRHPGGARWLDQQMMQWLHKYAADSCEEKQA